MARTRKTGLIILGIGVLLMLTGVALAGISTYRFVMAMFDLGSNLQQVKAPGTSQITVTEAGTQVIYHEYQSVFEGRHYSNRPESWNMECRVRREDGEEVTVQAYTRSENYSFGNRSGLAVWKFEAETPGVYEITASLPDGAPVEEIILAIGPSLLNNMFPELGWFAGGLLLGIASGIIGLPLLVVGILIRVTPGPKSATA